MLFIILGRKINTIQEALKIWLLFWKEQPDTFLWCGLLC